MTKKFRATAGAALFLAVIACGAASAAAPSVVVSIKPVQALVADVMEGVGAPTLLVQGSASPHAYTLRPSDAKMLTDANAVFWIGPEMETALDKPLTSLSGKATVVALLHADGIKVLRGGDSVSTDGHAWLDIDNAKAMVTAIAQTLSKVDPANSARYVDNAANVQTRLNTLDAELRAQLMPVEHRPFIVFHDAYRYFANRYGLNMLASVTVNPEQPPGGRHVAELQALIAKQGAVCVFAEPQFQPKLMRTLEENTQARSGVLDPEGSALPPGPKLYVDLMRGLADNLVRCLSVP